MIHLFSGENTFEVGRRLGELVAKFDGDVEKVDGSELSLDQLPDLLAGVTLFSSKRLIVIKGASQNKPVWAALGEWFEKGVDNEIVLVEASVDKRTKTFKWLEKHAKVFQSKELMPYEAVRWVQQQDFQGATLEKEVAEFFVDYVGTDQWRLSSELEKLRLSGREPSRELIEKLIEPTPQATSFELLDAAFRGQAETLERLFETVAREEDPYMFFGLLAGQIYALALIKTAGTKTADAVAKETGVHPFVLKKVSGLAGAVSTGGVQELVGRLAELDANMKSRAVEPWTQVHSFLKSLQM